MNKSGVADQIISHPHGGGAIKGLGETFSPDLHTGTGNLTVPIEVPAGRNGFHPQLALAYSTGHGNGAFGLGWALSLPGVARDTSKALPVYSDSQDEFVLSGSEALVPAGTSADGGTLYRPRTEGVFARIRHLLSAQDDYWEVRSRDGLTSEYGHPGARGVDSATVRAPDDPLRVFSWSLTRTTDPFGNRIDYQYEREPLREDGPHRWDQIYLKTIRYADYGPKEAPRFLVSIDFVYEARPDPFSSYRAGFEIRTTQRCTRIEVRTHAETVRLTRVYRLVYQDQLPGSEAPANGMSLLRRIEVEGVDGDTREALPPLEFGYTSFDPARRIYQALSAPAGAMPERSLAHPDFELADLFGRGLPDVVQIGDVSRYWRNLGDGRFDVPRVLEGLLPAVRLGDRGTQLADLDGDGQIDLVVSQRELNGYVPLTPGTPEQARPFVAWSALPPFALDDPELRLVDLDGDGVTDALRTGANFELYFHDPKLGWSRAEQRTRGDFDRFPDVHFSDPRVKLADMTGDGLQDIVFVDGAGIHYWPSLGNGRWGARIAMAGRVAFPDAAVYGGLGFDPRRVLLGDVDGDGVADLVYVESGRVTIWLNRSGNGWSDPIVVEGTPPVSDLDAVRLADVLGMGTSGVLWTYDLRAFADSTYKFLDLTGGTKPYLLNERRNNAGARTLVEYAPSTRFYLEDERRPETRWRSRLPFPVQVVARVEVIDELSGGKLTTGFRYHQGYWDADEREFRGFGLVEQLDSETFARYNAAGLHGSMDFAAVEPERFSPPTLTRTWFHQGQVRDSEGRWTESSPGSTTWAGDPSMFTAEKRPELSSILRSAAQRGDVVAIRHALRALRGSVLRTELFALDDSASSDRPYTVSESFYDVREIAAEDPAAPARIYFPFRIAARTTRWERGFEPMTRFEFDGGHDAYGLPRAHLEVAIPRGRDPRVAADATGEPYLASYTATEYARRDDADHYLVDRVARSTGHEVVNDGRPDIWALRDSVFAGAATLRVMSHARTFYDGDAFVGLPLGQLGEFGAAVRSESLVFTNDFLAATFDPADPGAVSPRPCYLDSDGSVSWSAEYPPAFRSAVTPLGGYVRYAEDALPDCPGGYFAVMRRHRYDFHEPGAVARGMPRVIRDASGADTTIDYDAYTLLPTRVTDPAGLSTEAEYDYRALQPREIVDPNGNATEFRYSPAGYLSEQYARGKNGEGDAAHPSVRLEYDLRAFVERGEPVSVRTVRRVHHDSETDVPAEARDATIESVEYSDGLGRLLQKRTQAEDTLFGDPIFGGAVISTDPSAPNAVTSGRTRQQGEPPNVVVSGWQRYDNKGRVIEKYEPFFAQGWAWDAPNDAQLGEKAVLFYDARGQLVRTRNPDGSEQLVVLGVPNDLATPADYVPTPWETYTFDANDNAGRTHAAAASSFSDHWNTPASIVVDALGRTVISVARNGPDPATDWYTTRSAYDLRGNVVAVTDALGRTAFRGVFDLEQRRWRLEGIDAGRRDTVFDVLGRPIEERDAKGALRLHLHDLLGRPSAIWARDDASGPVTLRQRILYGDGGSAQQPPAERSAARANNLLGQLTRHFDEAGLLSVAAVDFKGNVLEKSRHVIADAPMLAVFDDAAANGWQVTPFQVDWEPTGHQTLSDLQAALLEPNGYETSTRYDALNRAKSLQLPRDAEGQRRTLRPTYNRAGVLERMHLDEMLYVERIAYDARGQRTLIAYGNGVMTRLAYDPRTFRLERLRSEHCTQSTTGTYGPTGAALQDFTYAYDLAGNIVGIEDRTPGSGILNNPAAGGASDPALAQLLASGDALVRRFTYDPLYRLSSATGRECDRAPQGPPWLDLPRSTDLTRTRGYTETYRYDPVGNLKRLQHGDAESGFVRELTVATGSNRLRSLQLGQTTLDYVYDANGNLRSETTSRHFEWNHLDQLKAFRTQTDSAEPSVFVQCLYDADGQRVKKLTRKQGGQVEVAHYVEQSFEQRRWSNGAQSGQTTYLHVLDDVKRVARVRIGGPETDDPTPAVQFQLADHLGSSNVVLDDAGAEVNREEFTPYGETSYGSFARKRYRFTGMERDAESGLSYHSARYYAPHLARWVSADPIAEKSDVNEYRYASCNPIVFIDPNGKDDVEFFEVKDPKVTVKGIGWGAVDEKQKDSEGRETASVKMIYVGGKASLSDPGIEGSFTVLDVEVSPHFTDNTAFLVSAKAGKVKAGWSLKKGGGVEVTAFEAGIGGQAGPVKAKALMGLSGKFGVEDGKVTVKWVVGVGFEVQLDAGSILKAIPNPWREVEPTYATIDLPTGPEEVSTRYSYSAHEDPPPPAPKPVRRRPHPRPKSEPVVHGCQYGPGDPDPRARHKVDLWR